MSGSQQLNHGDAVRGYGHLRVIQDAQRNLDRFYQERIRAGLRHLFTQLVMLHSGGTTEITVICAVHEAVEAYNEYRQWRLHPETEELIAFYLNVYIINGWA